MFNNQSDLVSNFLHQTHLGKISLSTFIQTLPDQNLPVIPEIVYDKNNRYVKLPDNERNFPDKIKRQIPEDKESIKDILPDTSPVSMDGKTSNLSMEERYDYLANQFHLTSLDMKKQYQLALKIRMEIPPLLMRRIVIDAIGILRIILEELNPNDDKIQRISQRLNELDRYKNLFDRHC